MEAEADWDHLRTPETYLGYLRSENFASPHGIAFDKPATTNSCTPQTDHWASPGEWTIGERVSYSQNWREHRYRFHARDAHLVLSAGTRGPIPFRVLLDSEAPGPSHGVDVDENGNGVLRESRMYQPFANTTPSTTGHWKSPSTHSA